MNFKSLSIYLLLIFTLTLALKALALEPSSISVDIVPENPVPLENTTITLKSFSANLDSVLISWFVNDKSALSGIGKKSFSTNAPKAGSETKVLAKIFLPDGEIDKRISIQSSTMVLLWQANDSYVPPFYKGKALPGSDSEIKLVAMPEIRTSSGLINPKSMTYAWKKDYNNASESSGYGKNFFLYTNDYLESSNNVAVVASTTDQKFSSEANINIGTALPKISFYKKDASLGILWENALFDRHIIKSDETIVAVPYFISPKDILRPELVFSWLINDNRIDTKGSRKNLIPLKAEMGVSGVSKLRLEIENTSKIFQTIGREINIGF